MYTISQCIMSIITLPCIDKLMAIGLSKYEALAYLALLKNNNATALEIVDRSTIPRQRIYDTLNSLQVKGLCSVKEGRPRYYIAHQPEQALEAMLNYRKQQQAAENERQVQLIQELISSLNEIMPNGSNNEIPASPSQSDDDADTYRHIGGF